MTKKGNYILWLPSWYPNKYEPFNGDFVQRHAMAVSKLCSIVVCCFPQVGDDRSVSNSFEEIKRSDSFKEIFLYPAFKPIGIGLVDKVRYNYKYYNSAISFLKKFFRQYGLPIAVHVHVPMKAGILARWIKHKYGVNYLLTEHSSYYVKTAPNNFYERSLRFRIQVKTIFESANTVTTVSYALGKQLSSLFKLKSLDVIRNVVNTGVFNYAEKKNSVFTFIHVSTFSIEKNIDGILRTFKMLSLVSDDWRLVMLGPYEKKHQDFVITNNLERFIILKGEVSYESVADNMKSAHCLVLFSLIENFPCVVIEALCCGLPVIASDVGGLSEAITPQNGILVPSKDEKKFLEVLIRMIERYSDYDCKAISEANISKFNYDIIGEQFFKLYSSISSLKA